MTPGRRLGRAGPKASPYRGRVAANDGNGWVECRCGSRHWGRHGASGLLLLRHPWRTEPEAGPSGPSSPDDTAQLLLQLRAEWTHQGGSWGVPGGARDSHEDPVTAALREAHEEAGIEAGDLRVLACRVGADHVDWRYTYVIALAAGQIDVAVRTSETDELRWVALDEVQQLPLHPGLQSAWPMLRHELRAGLRR